MDRITPQRRVHHVLGKMLGDGDVSLASGMSTEYRLLLVTFLVLLIMVTLMLAVHSGELGSYGARAGTFQGQARVFEQGLVVQLEQSVMFAIALKDMESVSVSGGNVDSVLTLCDGVQCF